MEQNKGETRVEDGPDNHQNQTPGTSPAGQEGRMDPSIGAASAIPPADSSHPRELEMSETATQLQVLGEAAAMARQELATAKPDLATIAQPSVGATSHAPPQTAAIYSASVSPQLNQQHRPSEAPAPALSGPPSAHTHQMSESIHIQPIPLRPVQPYGTARPSFVTGQTCSNCGTTNTPLWRRSSIGALICNACGLYQKSRGYTRPPDWKRPREFKSPKPKTPRTPQGSLTPQIPTGLTTTSTSLGHTVPGTMSVPPNEEIITPTNATPRAREHSVQHDETITTPAQLPSDITVNTYLSSGAYPNGQGPGAPMCAHCNTSVSPLWRRDDNGRTICNACGLYLKMHNRQRPAHFKKDSIRKRKRVPAIKNPFVHQEIPGTSNSSAMEFVQVGEQPLDPMTLTAPQPSVTLDPAPVESIQDEPARIASISPDVHLQPPLQTSLRQAESETSDFSNSDVSLSQRSRRSEASSAATSQNEIHEEINVPAKISRDREQVISDADALSAARSVLMGAPDNEGRRAELRAKMRRLQVELENSVKELAELG